ncbi:LacI family DNA-binding transcriptional regulator [Labrys wisconsinensis]|uniref:LacI family transcriptional regulator n=1 Tax=Labrys wisconsinensis TaxID=425677 RepID=A0ABU0JQA0_9HYPH|nr:LacI family DNA-binding transcriptional regulator [Labrys wisconsinensis]MDQ0475322.1 LacI family transcriptional regulator [Labrys wisconsinensis]
MKRQKRVTIREVAADTGLALSTVSNALAGKEYVTEETRKIVNEAALRLGYRASAVARALRMNRSFALGVLIADVANPSSADFVRGVEDVAIEEKCSIFLCNTDGDEERQLWHMRTLLDRQVDGMVLISQHCSSPAVRQVLDKGTPFVLVQRRSEDHADDYVGSDNVSGIAEALRHLHELGHRRIGFVRGPADSSSARERLETYRGEARALGLDRDPGLVFAGDYTFATGLDAGRYFLGMERPPTAVLGGSDMNSLGIIEAASALKCKVPRDLSVIGLDDITLAGLKQINLTTIHLRKREMGTAAARMLMNRIRGGAGAPSAEIFPTNLVVRGTTRPPRTP